MRKTRFLVALAVTSLAIVAVPIVLSIEFGRSLVGDDASSPSDHHPGSSPAFVSPSASRATRRSPLHAPTVPETATAVAAQYALDAFSTVAGQATDAWIRRVVDISAPKWLSHIERANSAQGLAPVTSRPQLVSTFNSWSPPRSVGVTVELRVDQKVESLYVELEKVRGRYLVEATQ